MTTARQVINSTKPKKRIIPISSTPLGSIGYDNPRDDIERTKSLREGSIEKVPANANDIVNKSYCDANPPTAHAASHEVAGADLVDHDNLTNFVANKHIDWTNAVSPLVTTNTATVRKIKTGDWESTVDCVAIVGDAAGVQRFRVKDSTLATVFSVDSNGGIIGTGPLNMGAQDIITTGNIDGVNLTASNDIYTVAWADYGATSTINGFAGVPASNIWYKLVGKLLFVSFYIGGASNAGVFNFTIPYTASNSLNYLSPSAIRFQDNTMASPFSGMAVITANSNVINLYTDWTAAAWINVGNKFAYGQFWVEIV